jgi:hypothetical protein
MTFYGIARADVQADISCYGNVPLPNNHLNKPVKFVLHTYVDTDLKREIGAFIQYSTSKEVIPLVFSKYVPDTEDPDLGNYELYRIEIIDKKITGEYMFAQTGAGNKQGKYVKYTNFRTGKTILLTHTAHGDSNCKI